MYKKNFLSLLVIFSMFYYFVNFMFTIRTELLSLYQKQTINSFFDGVRVLPIFFLCCPIMCLYILCSLL